MRAGTIGDNLNPWGIKLFRTALFFAGMSAKLPTPGLRRALLAFG